MNIGSFIIFVTITRMITASATSVLHVCEHGEQKQISETREPDMQAMGNGNRSDRGGKKHSLMNTLRLAIPMHQVQKTNAFDLCQWHARETRTYSLVLPKSKVATRKHLERLNSPPFLEA